MSLFKIPCILVSAIGIHISTTDPSAPPSSKEKVTSSSESFFEWFMKLRGMKLLRISAWAASCAEVANILAIHIPSHIPEDIYGARAVRFLRNLHPTPITPAFLAGSIAIVVGGALRLYCMATLGKLWSFHLSVRKEHKLVTSGPYSVVRHPSYTGWVLQSIGIAAMYGSRGSWMRQSGILQVPFMKVLAMTSFSAFLTLAAWVSIRRPAEEDQMLQRALGAEWENWAKKVKYRLIPGVY
ncbi:Isoprenylcysteine carboxyl methyltransferase family-domain-containing protein [Suillus plorans]|uniref:Protein-S-isoprenylcysteine O-methyltransferase n=1 Tax=Suillus plorans TaxID=116603 RepID=A0A9P7AEM9_9AGAM|nr:Isoprenylcysteine carboxyl methyltransferase family-domain-containing protein [Suillus plorans]KAG1787278.1 Isoprenylcysteine carboxyl methyltransferase family-domain-containing protein [Suillus plorans]